MEEEWIFSSIIFTLLKNIVRKAEAVVRGRAIVIAIVIAIATPIATPIAAPRQRQRQRKRTATAVLPGGVTIRYELPTPR